MPSVTFAEENTVYEATPPEVPSPNSLHHHRSSTPENTNVALLPTSPPPPYSSDIEGRGLKPPKWLPSSSSTVRVHDWIKRNSGKVTEYVISSHPFLHFPESVLDSPATTPGMPRVMLLYADPQLRRIVEASDGETVTVEDVVVSLHQWLGHKFPDKRFQGVSVDDEIDGQLFVYL